MTGKRWGRKRGDAASSDETRPPETPARDDESTLADDTNWWWAADDARSASPSTTAPRTPEEIRESFRKKRRPAPPPTTKRAAAADSFSEYYSADSLFTTVDNETLESELFDPNDPYVVLGVPPNATWEQITAAHRRLAKLHHPDRLLSAPPEEQKASAGRMAEINLAHGELRRRRGV